MKHFSLYTLTLSCMILLLSSCASKTTSPSIEESATGKDPRYIVKKAIEKDDAKFDACFSGPAKKNEYFVGKLTYDIEFNNRIVTSAKLVESTFQTKDKDFIACVEKAVKGLELESQTENLPYTVQYPFEFGMDRE